MITVEFKNTDDPRIKLVVVAGSMDMIKMNVFTEKITEETKRGNFNFIFDMEGLTFINSAGMMDILMCKEMLREFNGTMSFFGFSEATVKILNALGMQKLVPICKSRQEAREVMNRSLGEK